MQVLIESAISLDATQRKSLLGVLEARLGKDVEVSESVNEAIIGGLRITIDGSRRIDLSTQGKLATIKKSIIR